MLGDVSSGKSSLVARLKGEEVLGKGHGLEYHYLDVTDSGREAESRLGVWILDGDPFHQNLLRFALTKANFSDTLVLLVALPLPEGSFTCNLGLPIVVVITKTDTMAGVLEKEMDYKEEHFDFLQYHLHGAALVYTSVREDKNCALLRSYLLHRAYGLPCPHAAYVVERDCVFVPAGWDSHAKAYLLAASTGSLTKDLSNTPFSDVITRPAGFAAGVRRAGASGSTPGRGGSGVGVGGGGAAGGGDAEQAEDEQVFLSRLQSALLKQSAAPAGGAGGPLPGVGGGAGVGAPGASRASVGGAGKAVGAATGRLPPGAAGQGASAAAMGANDGVLANFFNSLLSKRSGGSPGQQQQQQQTSQAGASPAAASAGGGSAPAKIQPKSQQQQDGSPAADGEAAESPVKRVGPPTPAQS
uniref:Dynein light intermediate chain n=1 Tax=Macrostomum lignano TaxID=282301 RepID=A0A1I8GAV2_9PLAT